MSKIALTESQLHLAVETLRSQHSNTLDLYKAVAALLFFQYNSTPTTNRMYQLVRKGSMSAPAEALRLFWQELRERSQVRMEQADIPQNLKQSAAALIAQLWEDGLSEALKITEENNQLIYTKIALAEQDKVGALDETKQLQNALLIAQQQLSKQDGLINELEKEIQLQQLEQVTLMQKIKNLQEQKKDLQQQYENTLLLQKEQMALNEQRMVDMEKYARLEIERVRQESHKLQKQNQQQILEQKQQHQIVLKQLQEQQQLHLYFQKQYQDAELIYQQTEQQNQELHMLLKQLPLSAQTNETVRSPSRLAKRRIKKPQ